VKKLFSILLFTLFVVPNASAAQRYIADSLFTYMHAGPSSQFRIIGSVNAGEKVELTNVDKDAGYSQIVDKKGRKGWVETRFITRTIGLAERLPKLEEELAQVKEQLSNARRNSDDEKSGLLDSLDVRNKQIAELEQSYNEISQQLTASQTEIRQLRAQIDTQKEDLLMKYFAYGGGVAGLGLLFGLVLPHLIPRRKKSNGGWA
jgi:SH3 domain protein